MSRIAGSRFPAGIEDVAILPLVTAALAIKRLWDATLKILIRILDYAFPILLQLVRIPLFTLRIVGDGIAALLKSVAALLPMSAGRRDAWRAWVGEHWASLRSKISYHAFEQAVHRAFEGGMAWVFRKCRGLSPGQALLVTFGAALWLPISFGLATAMHAMLIAQAMTLPAWMQLLHPLATILAKTKLLVLPIYPAAWPQTRKHPIMQGLFQAWHAFARLALVQKTSYRYRQIRYALRRAAKASGRAIERSGLGAVAGKAATVVTAAVTSLTAMMRSAAARVGGSLSGMPLLRPLVRRYAEQYGNPDHVHSEKLSERTRKFFERWSVKLSPEYYEAKDREAAARSASH